MPRMSEPAVRPHTLARDAALLARALVTALRACTLYPPEHPALAAALDRLASAITDATRGGPLMLAATPRALLVQGEPLDSTDPVVAECARRLHDADVLQLSFAAVPPPEALHTLLTTLALNDAERRRQGGPAAIWAAQGHPAIVVEQIDYQELLEREASEAGPARRDEQWLSIVRSIIAGRRTFTEAEQARLLEISRDAWAIGELAGDCTSAFCSTDGSPLLTTQAATVLAVYRHLAATVRVLDEERTGEVMGNLAVATASLDPGLAFEVLRLEEGTDDSQLAREPEPLARALRRALDEQQVAMLLARAMARTGSATSRLALMLETLAPDEGRRQRVLRLTRQLLSERDFGATRPLEDLQSSLEELMLKYDESPFVSAAYRQSLDVAAERAIDLAARDLPPERDEWLQTLGHESVRELSGQLLIDLLTLETVPEQAAGIAADMSAFVQELIVAGAYREAQRVAGALHAATVRTNAIAVPAIREALHAIGRSAAMIEMAGVLGELPAADAQAAADLCTTVGPSCVAALVTALRADAEMPAVERARAILVALGEPAIPALTEHLAGREWIVHRRLADVLGRIGTPAAVAPLQALLRHSDPRVLPEVVGALAAIDHPSAARALHTALRAATGPAREAIVQALVARRDRRVVPLLARVLDESAALGQDFEMTLQTIDAIASFQDDRALAPLASLARRRSWLAPRRTRRLRERAVAALQRIGTTSARDLLERLRATGDRQLRRIVGTQTRRATA